MFKVTGYYVECSEYVETREEARALIQKWVLRDKEDFGEDTSDCYYYCRVKEG